ncbi:APO protein 2, chloroplastic isoform X1 [Amborella trichopoda]|uniref:APO protein 2, chloroplastic isoform X1 n=2 Tax=Amborella trichopoda TaxID=13333 RepID=UPI0009BE8C98|nr:APO protein 2, chloroplastic isoform X1 [Amborella trichopoda]|eukprot:XP_020523635.1 APO protein 2, chloroplastic isoform X1 [Amborella trichopoda]
MAATLLPHPLTFSKRQHFGKDLNNSLTFRVPAPRSTQPKTNAFTLRASLPQNADFPRYYSKKEKRPFPVPVLELRRAARARAKSMRGKPRKPPSAPRNGLLVWRLIPVAYDVLNARTTLINNLRKLMKVVPVHACGYCTEIHVGPVGHPFKSCRGPRCEARKGLHEWTSANIDDVFVPVEAYHLFDRLGKRITHEERFSIRRIRAIVELCIQAGVDLPDLPTKRRRKPVIRIGKNEIIDANEDDLPDLQEIGHEPNQMPIFAGYDLLESSLETLQNPVSDEEPLEKSPKLGSVPLPMPSFANYDLSKRALEPTENPILVDDNLLDESPMLAEDDEKLLKSSVENPSEPHRKPILPELPNSKLHAPSTSEETLEIAYETLEAWDTLRKGANKLMKKYAVRACGYCPEVHVGPSGHRAQNCGAYKHQQRNGQHGWQAAILDDLIPPRYVWHVPDVCGPPLQRELKSFYGQAPAVVEICVQAGAEIPEEYKATMRLDIGIPSNLREAEMVV